MDNQTRAEDSDNNSPRVEDNIKNSKQGGASSFLSPRRHFPKGSIFSPAEADNPRQTIKGQDENITEAKEEESGTVTDPASFLDEPAKLEDESKALKMERNNAKIAQAEALQQLGTPSNPKCDAAKWRTHQNHGQPEGF